MTKEELRLALEVLKSAYVPVELDEQREQTIRAIEDELKEKKRMIHTDEDDEFERIERENNLKGQPYIYENKWNSISDDDIARLSVECALVTPSDFYFARAIETKLKELNS